MDKKLLPIGTVVMLKKCDFAVFIIGFAVEKKEEINKIYDYIGLAYPEGLIDTKNNLVFNNEDIEKILHMGYESEDDINYKNYLNEFVFKEKGEVIPNEQGGIFD